MGIIVKQNSLQTLNTDFETIPIENEAPLFGKGVRIH